MQRIAMIFSGLMLAAGVAWAQGPLPQGTPGGEGKPADAGPGGQRSSMRMAPRAGELGTLVREQAVQEELKLKDKQKAKLNETLGEIDKKRIEMISGNVRALRENGALQGPNPTLNREQIAAGQEQFDQESEQMIAQVLEPRQMTRLKQIALQQEGLIAVSRAEIADKINLSYPQREAIQGIIDEMREAQNELMRSMTGGTGMVMVSAKSQPGGGPPRPDAETLKRLSQMQEGRDRIRKLTLQRINKILSKKQGAALLKLMGEPFALKKLSPAAQGLPSFLAKPEGGADQKGSSPGSNEEGSTPTKNPRSPRAKRGASSR